MLFRSLPGLDRLLPPLQCALGLLCGPLHLFQSLCLGADALLVVVELAQAELQADGVQVVHQVLILLSLGVLTGEGARSMPWDPVW